MIIITANYASSFTGMMMTMDANHLSLSSIPGDDGFKLASLCPDFTVGIFDIGLCISVASSSSL